LNYCLFFLVVIFLQEIRHLTAFYVVELGSAIGLLKDA